MTTSDHDGGGQERGQTDPERSAAARRRLRELLDGTLAQVADEDSPSQGAGHTSRSEEDYLRDRPPHHGQ